MSERYAIVAWLRTLPKDEWYPSDVADAIERGEYLPGAHSPVDEVARLREAIALIREHLANGDVGKAIHAIDRGEVRKALDSRP